ncbi:tyrosine-type recombinase/integrase [Pseudomonas sp. LS1212]|uniref:tyrosine-type recombinase/integrase n=1 Tax=Pseudomonas sp. LS1212 TaxID=2972478 RepID=UPI00215C6272|nr:tyrosine-type recombinase/integrase [Pseudomonas sp. LS1212]UVJ45063.1 tyrosine-type recombinase/integrase [Pseudomonas sp. LS1212]
MSNLTDRTVQKAIRDAKTNGSDVWVTDAAKSRGTGRLRLRASANGRAAFYFRYVNPEGKQCQISLGVYDSDGKAGLTLKEAGNKAGALSKLYQDGHRDLHAYLAQQGAARDADAKAAQHEREEAERQASSGSLEALCNGYVAHLRRQHKSSARDVRNLLHKHVIEAFPALAATRAQHISHKDVNVMLSALVDAGKGRTAGKARAFLRAAYAGALAAEFDPTIHPDLHGFDLVMNPAALVPAKALARFNRVGERTLSESELRVYMAALEQRPGLAADAITLALFLGGQRIAQTLRLRPADVDLDAGTIVLFDSKGARQTPRTHVLPLNERALVIVKRLLAANGSKPFLFARHTVPVRPEILSKLVAKISSMMVAAGTAREPFKLCDQRRTAETALARMGISKDIRAQLLSHGLGTLQDRVYDRHSYMDEKKAALERWAMKLEEIASGKAASNVVPLRTGA